MRISLDETLEKVKHFGDEAYRAKELDQARGNLVKATVKPLNRGKYDHATGLRSPDKEVGLRATIPEGVVVHKNYLEYLSKAYGEHKRIVITPDIIWNTILAEVSSAVVANPDEYATMFTEKPGEKIEILVPGYEELDLDAVMNILSQLVPTDVASFLPDFTTTTPDARLTRYAHFAEMVSPYYSYSTFLCGFKSIDIMGDPEDYTKIGEKLVALIEQFAGRDNNIVVNYLDSVRVNFLLPMIDAIMNEDVSFFKNLFYNKRCGSGSQYEIFGNWPRYMYIQSVESQMEHNTPTHIARVEYKNINTGRMFALNCGLFYSTEDNELMTPHYAWVLNEIFPDKEEASKPELATVS